MNLYKYLYISSYIILILLFIILLFNKQQKNDTKIIKPLK